MFTSNQIDLTSTFIRLEVSLNQSKLLIELIILQPQFIYHNPVFFLYLHTYLITYSTLINVVTPWRTCLHALPSMRIKPQHIIKYILSNRLVCWSSDILKRRSLNWLYIINTIHRKIITKHSNNKFLLS